MHLEKKLSIIVTSQRGRLKYRNRVLKYLNKEISRTINIILVTELNDLRVKYDNVTIVKSKYNSVYDKILIAQKKVKTPYVAWLADDDFYTKEYLEKAVDYLDNNPNCDCVDSFAVRFMKNFDINLGDYCIPQYLWLQKNYKLLKKNSSFEKKTLFLDKFHTCGTSIHSVSRNKIFKSYINNFVKYKFLRRAKYGDKIFVFFCYLNGYIHHLFLIGHIRQDFDNWSSKNLYLKRDSFEEIINNKKAIDFLQKKILKFSKKKIYKNSALDFCKKLNSEITKKNIVYLPIKIKFKKFLISTFNALRFFCVNLKIFIIFNQKYKIIKKYL